MRKLLLTAAIVALASLPVLLSPKRPKFERSKVIIGDNGDYKTIEEFDAWLVAANRSPASKLLTVVLDAKTLKVMTSCWAWMNKVDMRTNNIRIHLFSVPPSEEFTIVEKIAST